MRKLEYMWKEHLEMTAMGFPFLDHLTKDDRDELEILNFYIEDCLWTFNTNKGYLDPVSIARLSHCRHELVIVSRHLDGQPDAYFERLLLMSKLILKRFKIKEALLIAKREAACQEEAFSFCDEPLFADSVTSNVPTP